MRSASADLPELRPFTPHTQAVAAFGREDNRGVLWQVLPISATGTLVTVALGVASIIEAHLDDTRGEVRFIELVGKPWVLWTRRH
jgi:hypothetical protein